MTLHEALKDGEKYLEEHGIADASVDAWLLLEYVTKISRAVFLAERQMLLPERDRDCYRQLVEKRGSHIPLQHLTGGQEFMGLKFLVNEHVLIPRQDTEILVEEALRRMRPGMRVLDLCTGSGCIAISLAKLFVSGEDAVYVEGADISSEALDVAKENAARLEADVRFWQSDLFAEIEGAYDMIVSNPPYIRTAVIEELEEEVRLHEPHQALDGKEDGLYFYRRIIDEGRRHLKKGGHLLFEIGYDQAEAVNQLLADAGYKERKTVRDLAGLDRVVTARI